MDAQRNITKTLGRISKNMKDEPGFKIIEDEANYIAIHKRAIAAITISLGLITRLTCDIAKADITSLSSQIGQEAYDNVCAMSDEEIDRIIDQILEEDGKLVIFQLKL